MLDLKNSERGLLHVISRSGKKIVRWPRELAFFCLLVIFTCEGSADLASCCHRIMKALNGLNWKGPLKII